MSNHMFIFWLVTHINVWEIAALLLASVEVF